MTAHNVPAADGSSPELIADLVRPGGPWTSHGHEVPGVTVAGSGRPPVARCGGPRICSTCAKEAFALLAEKERTDDD